jgi:hypothetical protein
MDERRREVERRVREMIRTGAFTFGGQRAAVEEVSNA